MGGRYSNSGIGKLNAKQRKTLEKMFRKQTPNDMRLNDVKSVLEHMNYKLEYDGGSAMRILKNGRMKVVHMPHHPDKSNQMSRDSVKKIRDFLRDMGDEP